MRVPQAFLAEIALCSVRLRHSACNHSALWRTAECNCPRELTMRHLPSSASCCLFFNVYLAACFFQLMWKHLEKSCVFTQLLTVESAVLFIDCQSDSEFDSCEIRCVGCSMFEASDCNLVWKNLRRVNSLEKRRSNFVHTGIYIYTTVRMQYVWRRSRQRGGSNEGTMRYRSEKCATFISASKWTELGRCNRSNCCAFAVAAQCADYSLN